MVVAGVMKPDPLGQITGYASAYSATVRRYDLGGPGDSSELTHEEVARTRVISSRISRDEADWFVARSVGCTASWQSAPVEARLVDADPDIGGGLYDHAL